VEGAEASDPLTFFSKKNKKGKELDG